MDISKANNAVKVKKIKGKGYVSNLAKYIKKIETGDQKKFVALIKHKYPDLDDRKSKMLPFLLMGSSLSAYWKTYTSNKDNQTGLFVGEITREENVFKLDINRNISASYSSGEGKRALQYLQLLFQRINKEFKIQVKGSAPIGKPTQAAPQPPSNSKKPTGNQHESPLLSQQNQNKKTQEKVEKYKEVAQINANELGQEMKRINKMLATQAIKSIKAKIKKKEPILKADLDHIYALLKAFEDGRNLYTKSKSQIRNIFPFFGKTRAKEKELQKLMIIARSLVVSNSDAVAQKFADAYFTAKARRKASVPEIKDFKNLLKKDILPVAKDEKIEQEMAFKIAAWLMKQTGRKKISRKAYKAVLQQYKERRDQVA